MSAPRFILRQQCALDSDYVVDRDALCNSDDQLDLRLDRFWDHRGGTRRTHVDHLSVAVSRLLRLEAAFAHRHPQVGHARLGQRGATDNFRVIVQSAGRVVGALRTHANLLVYDALTDDFGVSVDEYVRGRMGEASDKSASCEHS